MELRRLKRENAELLSAECAAVVHVDPASCRPGSGLAWLNAKRSAGEHSCHAKFRAASWPAGTIQASRTGISMGLRISSRASITKAP